MIIIGEDKVVIKTKHSDVAACEVVALGGPEDPVSINGIELDRDELRSLQYALLNFLNSGYFDMEG